MKTSYYANPLLDRSKHFLVQVSNSDPETFNPDYKINSVVPDWNRIVAPFKTGTLSQDQYRRKYKAQLDSMKFPIFLELDKLRNLAAGKEIVLLCYEKPSAFCHRHILAAWLKENGLEEEVEEMLNGYTPSLFGD